MATSAAYLGLGRFQDDCWPRDQAVPRARLIERLNAGAPPINPHLRTRWLRQDDTRQRFAWGSALRAVEVAV